MSAGTDDTTTGGATTPGEVGAEWLFGSPSTVGGESEVGSASKAGAAKEEASEGSSAPMGVDGASPGNPADEGDEDEGDKTPRDSRLVRLNLDDLNAHLVCRICMGYFRGAHTITECLHTFCKSCLLREFDRGQSFCPHCKVNLGPHPLNTILYDRTMQELVNKILPDLEAEDQVKEEAFYIGRGIKRKPVERPPVAASSETARSEATPLASALQARKRGRGGGAHAAQSSSQGQASSAPMEAEMNFKLSPEAAGNYSTTEAQVLPSLDKPFLKTSGNLKVAQLKKYIAKKCMEATTEGSGGEVSADDVEVLCNGASLGPELSMYFIKCTRWVQDEAHLLLNYRRKTSAIF